MGYLSYHCHQKIAVYPAGVFWGELLNGGSRYDLAIATGLSLPLVEEESPDSTGRHTI